MSTAEPTVKSRSSKSRSARKRAAKGNGADKLKTVVRRLPPNLPEDVFWQSVQPWVTEETVSWKAFYPGKIKKTYNKENILSRAYILFKKVEELTAFSQAYDGHVFRDKSGNESYAVVEFAPSQKVPPERKKADPRVGTIEQDDDYISFVESLKATNKPSESEAIEALIASSHVAPEPKSTPLLDALRAEKSAQRDKETILKAHAHYQHASSHLDSMSRREKEGVKRKGGHSGKQTEDGGKKGKRAGKGAKDAVATPSGPSRSTAGSQGQSRSGAPRPGHGPPVEQRLAPSTVTPANASASANTKDNKDAAKEKAERRTRPALGFGIASRQFEAALSGAGVVPTGDKKSRREREKERKAGSTPAEGPSGAGVASDDKGATEGGTESASRSPGRTQRGGGGGRRRGARSPTVSTGRPDPEALMARIDASQSPTPQPKLLPRPPNLEMLPASVSMTSQASGQESGGGRGGRGRAGDESRGGRGEGRGRSRRGRGRGGSVRGDASEAAGA